MMFVKALDVTRSIILIVVIPKCEPWTTYTSRVRGSVLCAARTSLHHWATRRRSPCQDSSVRPPGLCDSRSLWSKVQRWLLATYATVSNRAMRRRRHALLIIETPGRACHGAPPACQKIASDTAQALANRENRLDGSRAIRGIFFNHPAAFKAPVDDENILLGSWPVSARR